MDEIRDEHADVKKIKLVPCEVWSRIVGYMRPVQQWNAAKKAEFQDRSTFEGDDWWAFRADEIQSLTEAHGRIEKIIAKQEEEPWLFE